MAAEDTNENPAWWDWSDAAIKRSGQELQKLWADWQMPPLRTGVTQSAGIRNYLAFLAAPYERMSGKPATSSSIDVVPLASIVFPDRKAVELLVEKQEKRINVSAIDLHELRNDLHLAYTLFQVSVQFDSRDKSRKRYDHLVKIKKTTHRLRQLLGIELGKWYEMGIDWVISHPPQYAFHYIEGETSEDRYDRLVAASAPRFKYNDLVDALDLLEKDAEKLANASADWPVFDEPNPYENFLRGPLSGVYRKHFLPHRRTKVGLAGSAELDAAFCHFAQAAFEMMHVDYGIETIERMARDIKSGRQRRKGP